jgi:hypothetical protein
LTLPREHHFSAISSKTCLSQTVLCHCPPWV